VPPLPPLPPLPLSEPAALALPDPGPPQAKTQLSKDMPDCPLQSGRSQATSTKGLSQVLLSSRLDCLRVFLCLDTRRLYPTCCLFGSERNPSLTGSPCFLWQLLCEHHRQRSRCKDCGGNEMSHLPSPCPLSPHCHDGGCVSIPCRHGVVACVTLITRVVLSGRLDCLRVVLYLDTRRLYPTCCLFGRERNPSLTGSPCFL